MENNKNSGLPDWMRELDGEKPKPFDFDAFLDDDLESRVHAAMDERDLLRAEDYGGSEYTPRRNTSGRGRHEAPEPDDFYPEHVAGQETAIYPDAIRRQEKSVPAAEPDKEPEKTRGEESRIDPSDPRYAAPERPRIVVAQPRPQVVVDPPSADDDYGNEDEQSRGGGSGGLGWLVGLLLAVAVIGGAAILFLRGGTGRVGGIKRPTVTPTPPVQQTLAPTATPAPQAERFMITVTAGSGGSVSPSGIVAAEAHDSVTFTITPNMGRELTQLIVDGENVEPTLEYTFWDVTMDHTIYAVFGDTVTPTPEPTSTPEPTIEPTPTPAPEPEIPVESEPEIVPEPAPTAPPEAEIEPETETEPEGEDYPEPEYIPPDEADYAFVVE